jgi:hypothetical protein
MKESVCCVIGGHSAINRCAACILQTTVNWANWASLHLGILQDIAADRLHYKSQDYWAVFCVCTTAGCVNACLQIGPHKSILRCGFVYNCVQNARWTAVSVSVFVEWRTDYFFITCRHFQIKWRLAVAGQNNYSLGRLKKGLIIPYQLMQIWIFRYAAFVLDVNLNMQNYFTNTLYWALGGVVVKALRF